MFLAIVALLVQPSVVPLDFTAIENASRSINANDETVVAPQLVAPVIPSLSTNDLPNAPRMRPAADSRLAYAFAASPETASGIATEPAVGEPAITLPKPMKPMTVSVDELLVEERRNRRIWTGLGVAAHGAAAFDAWTTRRAIKAGGHEVNPLLKPFAGNASIYVAIQATPAVMDYVGRQMMYSRHAWIRRMWWVPQTASFAGSLFCGVHNLGVHPQY